jgi:hypothetical protein
MSDSDDFSREVDRLLNTEMQYRSGGSIGGLRYRRQRTEEPENQPAPEPITERERRRLMWRIRQLEDALAERGTVIESVRFANRNDRDRDFIRTIEQRSLFNYLVQVIIGVVVFFCILFAATFIQTLFPLWDFNTLLIIVFILFLVSQLIFYILKLFLIYVPFINWILLIIYLGIISVMIFLLANYLSFASIAFINFGVLLAYFFVFLLVFWTGSQLEEIKTFSPLFDASTFEFIVIVLFIFFEFTAANRSVLVWIYLPPAFNVYLQFMSEVVDLYRGVTAEYKGLYAIEGILVLCRLMSASYFIVTFFIYVIKCCGILLPIPFPPWYTILPPSWFTWL